MIVTDTPEKMEIEKKQLKKKSTKVKEVKRKIDVELQDGSRSCKTKKSAKKTKVYVEESSEWITIPLSLHTQCAAFNLF